MARLLPHLTPRELAELDRLLDDGQAWHELPGPQVLAFESAADELFYGGQAGGGKSDLLLGLAGTAHRNSIIFRREYTQLNDLVERSFAVYGDRGKFNWNALQWRLRDGRRIGFAGVQRDADARKWQGRAHDLKAFDELPNFTESMYRFLIGWNRTTVPGQRSRVVGAGNPPTNAEGEWVIRRWAAWLDGQHPRPAKPGELRWYTMIDGAEVEREDGRPFTHKGEEIVPKSRTFIPAKLADNPFLVKAGYGATLQAMPEPLRSQMLYGDFGAGLDDDPWQVIPTAWVRAAQARWTPERPAGPMTAVGVDVARGGKDATVLARRWGSWFAELEKHPGSATPDGRAGAALVLMALRNGGYANIDGIGVGASVYDHCVDQDAEVQSIIFSASPWGMDRSGKLRFANLRAYAYWSFREALDPDTGDGIALPPGRELLADLCSPRWSMRTNGVLVEPKEDISQRLGRSPDEGDAVVLAALVSTKPEVW